jgi:hypothetical protein
LDEAATAAFRAALQPLALLIDEEAQLLAAAEWQMLSDLARVCLHLGAPAAQDAFPFSVFTVEGGALRQPFPSRRSTAQ